MTRTYISQSKKNYRDGAMKVSPLIDVFIKYIYKKKDSGPPFQLCNFQFNTYINEFQYKNRIFVDVYTTNHSEHFRELMDGKCRSACCNIIKVSLVAEVSLCSGSLIYR